MKLTDEIKAKISGVMKSHGIKKFVIEDPGGSYIEIVTDTSVSNEIRDAVFSVVPDFMSIGWRLEKETLNANEVDDILTKVAEENGLKRLPAAHSFPIEPPVINVTVPREAPIFTKEEEVWLQAWCNTVRADNCSSSSVATMYADRCLADFKKTFGVKQ